MSTRSSLFYYDNDDFHLHIYYEMMDEKIHLELNVPLGDNGLVMNEELLKEARDFVKCVEGWRER